MGNTIPTGNTITPPISCEKNNRSFVMVNELYIQGPKTQRKCDFCGSYDALLCWGTPQQERVLCLNCIYENIQMK